MNEVAPGLTGRYFRRRATRQGKVLRLRVRILFNLLVGSAGLYGFAWGAFEWRVLVSTERPVGCGRCCKDRFGQNDFQLGTNGGEITALVRPWQALFCLALGKPSIMSTLCRAVKPAILPRMAAMVRQIALLWGGCTHLGQPLSQYCNGRG